jgi:hypothetical protein
MQNLAAGVWLGVFLANFQQSITREQALAIVNSSTEILKKLGLVE